MSASLVGSEMCIRDRPTDMYTLGRRPTLSGRIRRVHHQCARCRADGGNNCLLYTSDAADDM
eukprot:12960091-Alexandrium_andersonii.AAC.1